MYKRWLFLIFFSSVFCPNIAFVQQNFFSNDQLHLKYCELRRSLINDFSLGIGYAQGQSIPCNGRHIHEGTSRIHWGDALGMMGAYIGVLAMEYDLLSQNKQSVERVTRELYFALNAINRLDTLAEPYFFYPDSTPGEAALNGFLLRNDVANVTEEQLGILNSNKKLIPVKGFSSGYHTFLGTSQQYIGSKPVMSKDHIAYLFTGLALVCKLVPPGTFYTVNEQPVAFPTSGLYTSQTNADIQHEAQCIIKRIVEFMHQEPFSKNNWSWQFKNPVTGTKDMFGNWVFDLSYGFYHVAKQWTDYENINGEQSLAYQLAESAFYLPFTSNLGHILHGFNEFRMHLNLAAAGSCLTSADEQTDATLFLLQKWHRNKRNITEHYFGEFDADYNYIPGIYRVLFPEKSVSGFNAKAYSDELYNLIVQISCHEGPYHRSATFHDAYPQYDYLPDGYGAFEWSSSGRFIEPQGRGKDMPLEMLHSFGDYNGIDWMLFYNLYCMISGNSKHYDEFFVDEAFLEKANPAIHQFNWYGEKMLFYDVQVDNGHRLYIGAPYKEGEEKTSVRYRNKLCDTGVAHIHVMPGGKLIFNPMNHTTEMVFEAGTGLVIDSAAQLETIKASSIVFKKGSSLLLKDFSTVTLGADTEMIFEPGAFLGIGKQTTLSAVPGSFIAITNSTLPFEQSPLSKYHYDAVVMSQKAYDSLPKAFFVIVKEE